MSQPTLSSQIRKLEDELGVTLLERTNKRVEMTPVGSQILVHAQQALCMKPGRWRPWPGQRAILWWGR